MIPDTGGSSLQQLREGGYVLLPLPARSKSPPPKGWLVSREACEIPGGGNVAIGTRGELAILITNDERSTGWARAQFGEPNVLSVRGGHWYFRARPGQANEGNKLTSVGMMEFHVKNKYALIPPSTHPTGVSYKWGRPLPPSKDLLEAPDLRELWHPAGEHHAKLLSMSAASAHAGKDAETICGELTTYRDRHLPDLHAHPDTELRGMAESAISKFHSEGGSLRREAKPPITNRTDEGGGKRRPAADRLIEIGTTQARLFHDSSTEVYAVLAVGEHEETYRLRSSSFRRWLVKRFHEEEGNAPGSEALKRALETLGARAEFGGPLEEVHLRVAGPAGELWIDLGSKDWNAVHVTSSGWSVESSAPVHFVRGRTCHPFPIPERGGNLRALLPYLNASSVEDPHFVLAVAWVVGAFHPRGPYPILDVHGEQGSGKSTGSRFLRKLADPSSLPIRSAPRDERDLAVAAQGNRVIAFDNLSSIPDWLSDALCRLTTGGGFGTRQLYTDDEEMIFCGTRPVLINGIPLVGDAADFRDRALPCAWPLLSRRNREEDLAKDFERDFPAFFGAILDALVMALAHANDPAPATEFRMADFAAWVMRAEAALPWPKGTFEKVYTSVRQGTTEDAIAESPVAQAIRTLAAQDGKWEGSATDLMPVLASLATPKVDTMKPPSWWPKSPKALGHTLKRLAPDLRRVGVGVERTERRTWAIRPYPPPPCKGAQTNDTNDQTTGSPRETSGRLGGRLPFGDSPETTGHPSFGRFRPFPVVSASPKEPQTTTAVDVVSVVSVVSLRPKEECVTPACRDCANCRTTEHKAADCLCASCTPWGGDFKLHWCGPPRTPVARANPFFYPPGGYRSGEAPTERYCVEGVEGVTIQGGEVFYDPPEEPSQAKEPRHE